MESAVQVDAPKKGRLLLVDDEENILRSIRRVLRHGDWEIHTAPDAERGLSLFDQVAPEVVMSDFRMPGMNGVEFLSRVKALNPRAQRIMLTGQADQLAIEEAINRSEIFRFISKPWNDAQLILTVKSAFEQFQVGADNARLHQLTQSQNDELRLLNSSLEDRVHTRTRQLLVAKREWELTFDSIDLPLAVVSNDLQLRRANLAYGKVADKPIQHVGQRPKCHQYLFDRSSPCPGCPVLKGFEKGRSESSEIEHAGRTFVVSMYPMFDEGQAVCSYRDVTEERQFTRRLVDSEKMVAVGHLAGGVAHEINNPLGGILAFSQLMKRDAGRSDEDRETLDLIEESALRCKRIVESLLQFSRKSRKEDRRLLDLSKCVEDAVLLFRAQLKSSPKAVLSMELAPNLPRVFADSVQLGQVVLNLLQNALHALIRGEGAIKVKTGISGERCFASVSDTGSGIRSDHLPHVFEPHFTTKAPGEGTGLGLSIAYRIVVDHGGDIQVETALGQGTTFTIWLPIPSSERTESSSL